MTRNDSTGPGGRRHGDTELTIGVGIATLILVWFAAAALAG